MVDGGGATQYACHPRPSLRLLIKWGGGKLHNHVGAGRVSTDLSMHGINVLAHKREDHANHLQHVLIQSRWGGRMKAHVQSLRE